MDQELYEARKKVQQLKGRVHRLTNHAALVQAHAHKYKLKYKSEVNSWRTLAAEGGKLLREVLRAGKVSAMFRHRVQQHLVVLPHDDSGSGDRTP